MTSPRGLEDGMTRDLRRDREALGVTIAWYCNLCNRSIPIADERTAETDFAAHVARHRVGEEPRP